MNKKSKTVKKNTKKVPKIKEINPKIIEEILEKEAPKKEIKEKTKETLEEETPEEFFPTPQQVVPRRRNIPVLEEAFVPQNLPEADNLEESLAGVETPKKEKDSKEFYSTISYGAKQEESDHKYGSPIQSGGVTQRQEERGSLSVMDIKGNRFVTSGIDTDVKREIAEYASNSPEERYNVRNLEKLDPTDLNRDRNRNPFLRDVDKVDIKYE